MICTRRNTPPYYPSYQSQYVYISSLHTTDIWKHWSKLVSILVFNDQHHPLYGRNTTSPHALHSPVSIRLWTQWCFIVCCWASSPQNVCLHVKFNFGMQSKCAIALQAEHWNTFPFFYGKILNFKKKKWKMEEFVQMLTAQHNSPGFIVSTQIWPPVTALSLQSGNVLGWRLAFPSFLSENSFLHLINLWIEN